MTTTAAAFARAQLPDVRDEIIPTLLDFSPNQACLENSNVDDTIEVGMQCPAQPRTSRRTRRMVLVIRNYVSNRKTAVVRTSCIRHQISSTVCIEGGSVSIHCTDAIDLESNHAFSKYVRVASI
jgi:hypothetical protein